MEDADNRRRQEPDLAQQSSCSLAFRPPTACCIRGREAGEQGRTRRRLLSRKRDRFAHSPTSYQCLNCDAGTGNPRAVLHLAPAPLSSAPSRRGLRHHDITAPCRTTFYCPRCLKLHRHPSAASSTLPPPGHR